MNELIVKEMNRGFAEEILSWKYEPPYDLYNNELSEDAIQELLTSNYKAVVNNDNDLIGFYCAGNSAQVPAGHQFGVYKESYLDLGIGMKPALTGAGNGTKFFSFILEQIQKDHELPLRLTVAKFNERAIRLYEKLGFVREAEFKNTTTEFITMVKEN
ncbi:GNAT family N-acetyltransferase [Ureibacillus manganicus]|nr:GNAT family N-acetyltransferase [Ureibacillus manganicus]